MINSAYLSRKLTLLGVCEGDILFVHSAFSAVGKVDGGADALLDALLGAIGSVGTVIFPTFTFSGKPFSREDSPSEMGVLSEIFRCRSNALRSLHPTHSVAAIGRQAAEFAGDEWIVGTTCGEGSMYMRLARSEAKMMMLGVDLNRCTLLHACEDAAELAYILPEVSIVPPVGRPDITSLKRYPPGHRAFIHLMETVRNKPWFTQGYIGDARTLVFPARVMYTFCMNSLRNNPHLFLCENESCNYCEKIRQKSSGPDVIVNDTGSCPDPHCEVCAL